MTDNSPRLVLELSVVAALRAALPGAARRTVEALDAELPAYSRSRLGSEFSATLERSVELALAGFLDLAGEALVAEPAVPLPPAVDAAYQLGRGEARSGRPIDVLLAAYRIGARVAWRDLSEEMLRRSVPAATVATFAELVFAYIDQLSAASVAGHNDETVASARAHEQHLERLGRALLGGAPAPELEAMAERAEWAPPQTLTAVVLPSAQLRQAMQVVPPASLAVAGDVAPGAPDDAAVLLAPDVDRDRAALLHALHERGAVVGPSRPWTEAHRSYARARRVLALPDLPRARTVDTDAHLVELVLGADADALGDLRRRALEPLAGLRPATAERLAETLRSWLLHQGRRDAVAAALHVHPQTVRYRMNQIRDAFGARLDRPADVLELVVALGASADTAPTSPAIA